MSRLFPVVWWIGGYLMLVLAPLFILLVGTMPPGSGFWWDFSMAMGFTGMAMMCVQFLLTARFPFINDVFGIDIIYYFHRYLALMAISLIVLHILIIRINYAEVFRSIDFWRTPWEMTAALISTVLFMLLIASSLWRKILRIHYEAWRMLHIGLAIAAVLLALWHIEGVGYYVDVPLKHWLWHGYTLFLISVVIYVRIIKPWQMYRKPYRITEIRQERGNCWTLALKPDGHQGMRFKPGQFAWLTLRASPWHIKEHPFSFSSSPSLQGRLEFTIKALGDFTRTIKDSKVGEVVYLDGAYGTFTIARHQKAPGFVFIAGGVGAAPIISMLRSLADHKDKRPLWFIYGNNDWEDVIFREELEVLKKNLDLRLTHILVNPPHDGQGETGMITQSILMKLLPEDAPKYEYFLCGPKSLSNNVQQGLFALNVPQKKVHFELFDMV